MVKRLKQVAVKNHPQNAVIPVNSQGSATRAVVKTIIIKKRQYLDIYRSGPGQSGTVIEALYCSGGRFIVHGG